MYSFMYMCVCVYMYIHTCMCVCVCVYMYIHLYVYNTMNENLYIYLSNVARSEEIHGLYPLRKEIFLQFWGTLPVYKKIWKLQKITLEGFKSHPKQKCHLCMHRQCTYFCPSLSNDGGWRPWWVKPEAVPGLLAPAEKVEGLQEQQQAQLQKVDGGCCTSLTAVALTVGEKPKYLWDSLHSY